MQNALASAITDHLDEMGEGSDSLALEQYVEGLRAHLDILLDTGADLTAFADELDIDYAPALADAA